MDKKLKKCKGTGVAKNNGCGREQYSLHYGLCNSCYASWLLNTKEGQEKLNKSAIKAKKQVKSEYLKLRRAEKESIINYKSKLQTKINEIVRLIDIGQPCLARKTHASQIHAGHIYSRGSNPTIKFNLHNIHRQSAQSNHFQNEDGLLREGLINEYGEEYMEFISGLRSTKALKYSNDEYKAFYKKASKIVIDLKKAGQVNTKRNRILLRNMINIELSIYKHPYTVFNHTKIN